MRAGGSSLQTAVVETTWGDVCVDANARGVVACRLPVVAVQSKPLGILRIHLDRCATPLLRQAADFVCARLEGREPVKSPPLDVDGCAHATAFRRAIWGALQKIPRGHTQTYSELAQGVGHPRAARAAGTACGDNPLPLFVPCHRAVAAGGRVGGFSAGLAWKTLLLTGEGVLP